MAVTTYQNIEYCPDKGPRYIDFDSLVAYSVDWFISAFDRTGPDNTKIVAVLNFAGQIIGFLFNTDNAPTGDYTVTFTATDGQGGDSLGDFKVNITVTDECITETTVCCKTGQVVIRWLSVEGGIKQFPFPGVIEYEVRQGDALTFKNNNLNIQYSKRQNIYAGKSVSTGRITKSEYDFVSEAKLAVQAWEWDETTETATPILIDNESFFKYKSNSSNTLQEFTMKYIVAAEAIIQTQ